ncbi:MAG: hypothetical protein MSS51_08600 [Bacteroidales bacterium]|nr:hypothetical protein [Bacteroidales bacterium]
MARLYGIAGDIYDRLVAEGYANSNVEKGTAKPIYTHNATLLFKRSELLYDIKNIAYVEGDVIRTDNEHERHQIMDIGEDGNIDRVSRVMDLAMSQCRELLYPYSRMNVEEVEQRDDVLTTPEEYTIELLLPDDFSKSTLTLLEKLIHEYLVYRVLMDWMSITNLSNPASATNWAAKMQSLQDEIESTLNARIRRVRRTQTIF